MKIIKLIAIGGLLLVAAALLIKGPRPVTNLPEWATQPNGSRPIEIVYWEKWTGTEGSQMQEIVTDFNRTVGKEKGIYVHYLSMSKVNEKALVATAAGVPPDIVGIWDTNIAQWSSLGALEPLDEMAKQRGITRDIYKPVLWDACSWEGRLYGLVSTPGCVALHYNRRTFQENADKLRAAGLDPDRPPRTIQELDAYATALDLRDERGRIKRTGYLPLEPGWYTAHTPLWFGGDLYDPKTQQMTLTSPQCVTAFDWIRSYTVKLGIAAMTEFRSGFQGLVDSPQNAFLTGQVTMVQQGPWMANYIDNQKPAMNRWNVPREELDREKAFDAIKKDLESNGRVYTFDQVTAALGPPRSVAASLGSQAQWRAGPRDLVASFDIDRKLTHASYRFLPADLRRKYYEWAAAPFPSAVPGLENVTYVPFDVLAIPSSAKHKKEAFEFVAYVQRQDVAEKLNSLHCKISPLRNVSREYLDNHPNPYAEVFEMLAMSPNARPVPPVPIWPEMVDETSKLAQALAIDLKDTRTELANSQQRLSESLDRFLEAQRARERYEQRHAAAR